MNITFDYNGKTFANVSETDAKHFGFPLSVFQKEKFAYVKKQQLVKINAQCEQAIKTLTSTYPDGEVSTFDKQESEARAYLTDAAAPTPLLDALAQHRGMDKDELVSRVIEKADAFAAASGAIIGKRQKLEDALNLLTSDANTINDIAAITW